MPKFHIKTQDKKVPDELKGMVNSLGQIKIERGKAHRFHNKIVRLAAVNPYVENSDSVVINLLESRTVFEVKENYDRKFIYVKDVVNSLNATEVICMLEVVPRARLGKRRYLRNEELIRARRISNAIAGIYQEESDEIESFTTVMENLSKSTNPIQQTLARMRMSSGRDK